jgi:DnaJ like chaperone protein
MQMGWLGKVVGGTIGFAIGGPIGAVAGAAFGHAFDKSEQYYYDQDRPALTQGEEAQMAFFVAAFSMMAKVVKADGRIAKEELDAIEQYMRYDLKLDPQSQRVAVNIFQAALESNQTIEDFASQFYLQFQTQPRLLEFMIDLLLRIAAADKSLSADEESVILKVARVFRISDMAYNHLRSKYAQDVNKYYAVLGSSPNDSNEEIKTRYRAMVREYHPDTIASKGLPEEFTKFAEEKFREIQEAYDHIKKERQIK